MKHWLVVTAGLAAATRGASVELASTAVLSEAVSAEVITASEDLAPEDSVTLQAAMNLTTEARLAIPTGLRATTTPTARTAAAIRSAAFPHQIGCQSGWLVGARSRSGGRPLFFDLYRPSMLEVRFWHKADMLNALTNVHFEG